MRNKLLIIVLCFVSLFSLSACSDIHEIDDFAHVFSLGIDRGISNKWRLTVQVYTMKEGGGSSEEQSAGGGGSGGGGKEGQDGYTAITVDAPSFFGGINMINSMLTRKLNFMHAKFLVISEDLAKSGLVGEYLAPIARYREIRRNIHILISKKPATEFIKENTPFIGKALSKSMELQLDEWANTGFIPAITLDDFYDDIKSTYHQAIAILASANDGSNFKEEGSIWGTEFKSDGDYVAGQLPITGGNTIELFGTAVFDGDTMVGELNGDETRLLLMARGQFKRSFYTIPDPLQPELIIPLNVQSLKKPTVKIQFKDEKPIISLKIYLEGDLLAVQSRINYESKELKAIMENAFKEYIKNGLDELTEKCKKLNSDILRFGSTAARQFATIEEWEEYNWIKQFEKAEITTEVEFVIRRSGQLLKSSPIIKTKGKE